MLIAACLFVARRVYASPFLAMASPEEPEEQPGSIGFWMKLLASVGLVVAGGVFAG